MKTSFDKHLKAKVYEVTLKCPSDAGLDLRWVAEKSRVNISDVTELLEPLMANENDLDFVKVMVCYEAVKLGEEPQRFVSLLTWRQMERFVALSCISAGMKTKTNLVLNIDGRRAQVDVISATETLCLVIDCKRWKKQLSGKSLKSIVEKAMMRTLLVKKYFEEHFCGDRPVFFVPLVISLYEPSAKQVDGVFIVPVNALRGLLSSVENVLSGAVVKSFLKKGWSTFLETDNLNQSLNLWR